MSDDIGPDGLRAQKGPEGLRRGPEGAADDLDAEGHRRVFREPEGAADEPGPEEIGRRVVAEDEGDDTEGHRRRM
jgi:hypothetical protein